MLMRKLQILDYLTKSETKNVCAHTVLSAAGLINRGWHGHCSDGGHTVLLGFLFFDSRNSWCVWWQVVQDFPIDQKTAVDWKRSLHDDKTLIVLYIPIRGASGKNLSPFLWVGHTVHRLLRVLALCYCRNLINRQKMQCRHKLQMMNKCLIGIM